MRKPEVIMPKAHKPKFVGSREFWILLLWELAAVVLMAGGGFIVAIMSDNLEAAPFGPFLICCGLVIAVTGCLEQCDVFRERIAEMSEPESTA